MLGLSGGGEEYWWTGISWKPPVPRPAEGELLPEGQHHDDVAGPLVLEGVLLDHSAASPGIQFPPEKILVQVRQPMAWLLHQNRHQIPVPPDRVPTQRLCQVGGHQGLQGHSQGGKWGEYNECYIS